MGNQKGKEINMNTNKGATKDYSEHKKIMLHNIIFKRIYTVLKNNHLCHLKIDSDR